MKASATRDSIRIHPLSSGACGSHVVPEASVVHAARKVPPRVRAAGMRTSGRVDPEPPAPRTLVAPTFTGLIREVAGLVEECVEHGNCYFVIEAPERHRYVQGLIRHRDTLWLESVSDGSLANCCEEHCLTAEQRRTLVYLAWRPPEDDAPNWYRELDLTRGPARLAAELLVRTLITAHAVQPGTRLGVLTGESLGPACRATVA